MIGEEVKMKKYILFFIDIIAIFLCGCTNNNMLDMGLSSIIICGDYISEQGEFVRESISYIQDEPANVYNTQGEPISNIENLFYQQFLRNEIEVKASKDAEVSFAIKHFNMVLEGTLNEMIEQYTNAYGDSELSVEYILVPLDDINDALAVAISNANDVENPDYVRLECILMVVEEKLQIVFEGGQYNRDWLSIYENGYLISGFNTANTHESVRYLILPEQGVIPLYNYFSGNMEYYGNELFESNEQKQEYQEFLNSIDIARIIMNEETYYTIYMYECEDAEVKSLIINSGIFNDGIYCDSNKDFENIPIQYALQEYNIDLSDEPEWLFEWNELEY